jgi:hypothetical protein
MSKKKTYNGMKFTGKSNSTNKSECSNIASTVHKTTHVFSVKTNPPQ